MIKTKQLPSLTANDVARFKSKLITTKHGCIIWRDALNSSGRALFWAGGRYSGASRIAWFIESGIDPGDNLACHTCDNGACVNPRHLFLGDHLKNMADRDAIGRTYRGEEHPSSKLTEADVKRIRKMYSEGWGDQRDLAAVFNVSQLHISRIIRKVAWAHV